MLNLDQLWTYEDKRMAKLTAGELVKTDIGERGGAPRGQELSRIFWYRDFHHTAEVVSKGKLTVSSQGKFRSMTAVVAAGEPFGRATRTGLRDELLCGEFGIMSEQTRYLPKDA